MSSINKAISEIFTIEEMANSNQWLNRIHPLVKLALTIGYIATVVSCDKYQIVPLLQLAVYPLVSFIICDYSFKEALYRLRVVLPIVCCVGIFNPFFDRQILLSIGGIAISGGVLSMVSLMIKGILTVLASYLLVASTPVEKLCYALRMVHVPKIMVTQLLLIFRYINVLLDEVHRLTQAYSLRAPGQKGVHISAWGSLVGQLLLRTIDRADNIYESMCLRGYNGEFYFGKKIGWSIRDLLFLVIWVGVFAGARLFPVFQMVGSLFR